MPKRNPTLTFIDSSVLIVAWRASDAKLKLKALSVLADPNRSFAASDFVELEVMPKAVYHRQQTEQAFYQNFFARLAVRVRNRRGLEVEAYNTAARYGLNAMDALHIAAAIEVGAAEFITAERPTSPLFRVRGVKVVSLI
jgi:predicted nucleic acid-binding protein